MLLQNSFTLGLPVEDAWEVLLDVERVAPCLPGAKLEDAANDEFRGRIKVKVGAMTVQYKGTVRLVEADAAARRVVFQADGRETAGQGSVAATMTAHLRPEGGATHVQLETDLALRGRVAQFGRGLMADISERVLAQFASNLDREVSSKPEGDRQADGSDAIDLLALARGALAKRAAVFAGVAVAVALFVVLLVWLGGVWS